MERYYGTVALSSGFRTDIAQRMSDTLRDSDGIADRLRRRVATQLKTLSTREDGLLNLVGHPDWPQDKLSERMRAIRDERARLEVQLRQADVSPLSDGVDTLEAALRLLSNPLALYRESSPNGRKVLNRAVFTRLYLDAVDDAPVVAGHELAEPFAPLIEAERGVSLSAEADKVLERRNGAFLAEDAVRLGLTSADLLAVSLTDEGSSKAALVEMAGIEPASCGAEPGLLRAQSAVLFSAPAVTRTSCRRAQPLFDFLQGPVTGPRSLVPLMMPGSGSGTAPGLTLRGVFA